MNFILTFKTRVGLLALLAVLAACSKQAATPAESAKTLDYFSKNPAEATQVAANCKVFEKNEFSAMPPTKQEAWKETVEGINCKNAIEANAYAAWASYQKRLAESGAKYGKPAASANQK